jgi:hypothetical protein
MPTPVQAQDSIQLPQEYKQFELTMAGDIAVASAVRKIHATDEQVTCEARVFRVGTAWKAAFRLYSSDAGDSTYHAQAEANTLANRSFRSAQRAMETALDAVESGFESLAAVRDAELDGESERSE